MIQGRTLQAFVLATIYGVALEGLQSFVPNRCPDALDALSNAAGALLACVAWPWTGGLRIPAREGTLRPGDRPEATP